MVVGCPAVCIPPRALRGCGVDLSRALCPKRAPVARLGRVGAQALDRALGCGMSRGRGV